MKLSDFELVMCWIAIFAMLAAIAWLLLWEPAPPPQATTNTQVEKRTLDDDDVAPVYDPYNDITLPWNPASPVSPISPLNPQSPMSPLYKP